MRRARRATGKLAESKKQASSGEREREKESAIHRGPSSTPLHFCHTDMELVLGTRQIRRGSLLWGWFGHGDHDCDMEARVCWRTSEEQAVFGALPGDGACDVALDISLRDASGGRVRVYKGC